ncbi:MAG: GNAT family N-acetyltransferase [Candidatus Methylomirabilis sp.]|nr:GNAT family N-acetyltransferase [Candidatus Methylomirabilis sp.]
MKPQDEGICLNPAGRWAIRPYRSGDEGRILSLFQDVFSVDRTLEHWRWKFQANPAGSDYIRLAEAPSGELVGQYAALPVRVSWGATTQIFTQIIDVMVDRRFRLGLKRPGLFAALANAYITDYLVSGKVAVGYGFPTPEACGSGSGSPDTSRSIRSYAWSWS